MPTFSRYLFRNLAVATVSVALILAVIIFLTQSLRFLELVIESGASSLSFWILTLLALPRFFEIIFPLSLMAATIFIYNRLQMDSELIVMRAAGLPPLTLARPAIMLAALVTVFLWGMTMWAAPKSLSQMQQMRQIIKTELTNIFFREGVFNQLTDGLTIYIRDRSDNGDLLGLMIHDSRDKDESPATITARRGHIVEIEDGHQQVVVYQGLRQNFDTDKDALNRLQFDRYTIDIPDSAPVRERWPEPDERTIWHLLNPDMDLARDRENLYEFRLEIHRRFTGPFLALSFTLLACLFLLLGPLNRRGQAWRISAAILSAVVLQGLFLAVFNIARQFPPAILLLYVVAIGPGLAAWVILCAQSGLWPEKLFKGLAFAQKPAEQKS